MPKLEKEVENQLFELPSEDVWKRENQAQRKNRQEIRAEINEKINKPLARLLKEKSKKHKL